MGGFLFKTNYHTKTCKEKFEKSLELLNHRGIDETSILYKDDYSYGQKRLAIIDKTNGQLPMSYFNNHLLFDGVIYNHEELSLKLKNKPVGHSDTAVFFNSLIERKEEVLDEVNGMFSFVYTNNDGVIAGVDHLGCKPLYYTIKDGDLIIASEIKSILSLGVEPVMGIDEVKELVVMSPSSSISKTLYKGIFTLPAGSYLTFDKEKGLNIVKYFKLKREKLNMTHEDMVDKLRYLLKDSIKCALNSDKPIASFLSGGLDSSAVVAFALEYLPYLNTYSIDYAGNKEDFKANEFEKSRDEDYIKYIVKSRFVNHKSILIDEQTIIDYLKSAVLLRDCPGMTDIDSSLLYLAKEVSNNHTVVLSGEGADELLGGYPWFRDLDYEGFPWIRNVEIKESLLKEDLKEKINIKDYLKTRYLECVKEAPISADDTKEEIKELKMNYLNIKYFMKTLLDRHDRMTMGARIEARMPFGDRRIVEFLYNVPLKDKCKDNVEKKLLREAMEGYLPNEVLNRKKSPYPKSRSKKYHKALKKRYLELLNKDTPLYKIFDKEKLQELLKIDEFDTPWYGQLMRYDAMLAWLYQIDYWLCEYNVRIEIDE